MSADEHARVLALTGGVGGAKLALGLQDILPPGRLHALVNTGDDFSHLGLHISPDIDTLLYTLSGRADPSRGWGLEGESWHVMDALADLGGETWFRLGDRDLATHLWRTHQLAAGSPLSEVTDLLARRMGIASRIHPMSEAPVRTVVHSNGDTLPFQRYFVEQGCEPAVSGFSFAGIGEARPNTEVLSLLRGEEVSAIVVCPSNPFVSIGPMLGIADLCSALRECPAQLVLVSPIVGGVAIKGPAAKMMAELGMPVSALGVAQHYCDVYPGLLDYFVIDESDATLAQEIGELGLQVAVTPTIMNSRKDKQRLARYVLNLTGGQGR